MSTGVIDVVQSSGFVGTWLSLIVCHTTFYVCSNAMCSVDPLDICNDLTVLCQLQVVALIKSCWKHEPDERPTMADVTEIMHDIVSRVKKRVKAEHRNRPGHVVPHA